MQELLTRRKEALEYYRLQCDGFRCEHMDDAENEIDANFSNVGLQANAFKLLAVACSL